MDQRAMDRRAAPVLTEPVERALAGSGLALRGLLSVQPGELDFYPGLAAARAILLVGNVGGCCWPVFQRWRADQPPDLANPLDTWSRTIIDAAATTVGATAVYPSDKPYLPFQAWAMRAEGLQASPLGILMHPEFGVWHAYRGALLLEDRIDLPAVRKPIHLCDLCAGKPCKKACPVKAHGGEGFDYPGCLDHVRGPHGEDCRSAGCLDRNACPYGAEYRYPAEMQAFIMRAFAR